MPVRMKLHSKALVAQASAVLQDAADRVTFRSNGVYVDKCLIGWSGWNPHPRHIWRMGHWEDTTPEEAKLASIGQHLLQMAHDSAHVITPAVKNAVITVTLEGKNLIVHDFPEQRSSAVTC